MIIWLIILMIAGAVIGGWLAFQYTIRDPERIIPKEDRIVIAPADGTIKYIKRIKGGKIPYSEKKGRMIPILESTKTIDVQDGYLIGIWMSFLVVHVQRVPVSGVVEKQYYHACGKFLDPHLQEGAEYENERNVIAIKSKDFPAPILVIQIASIMVRRIVSYLEEGMNVNLGDRLGIIKMGSQVDIVVPDIENLKLSIEVGDRVRAGESIIARY